MTIPLSYNSSFTDRYPSTLLLTALAGGIQLQAQTSRIAGEAWIAATGLAWIAGCLLFRIRALNSIVHRLRCWVVLLCFCCAGGLLAWLQDPRRPGNWYGHYAADQVAMTITISGTPVLREKTICLPATVQAVRHHNTWQPVQGNIRIYVYRKNCRRSFREGQRFLMQAALVPIENNGNPGSFDYRGYAARQGLFHQVFVSDSLMTVLPPGTQVGTWLENVRRSMTAVINDYITDNTTRALAAATVLNERSSLDDDLMKAYSVTGIVHIVAISGMHISLLAGMVLFALKPLSGSRARKLKYLLASIVVWVYIALSGCPPSAVRAGVMFSLLAAGIWLGREGNSINTWAAAGLLMLCYNTRWLYDPGVQLSFLAVLSILLFYPAIRRWWVPGNRWLRWLWEAVAVSIAAQVLVFPLVIWYFHQFPLLALPAAIPAALYSILLLYGATAMFLLHLCGAGCQWTGDLLTLATSWFHHIIRFLAGLTPPGLQQLYLRPAEYCLLMIIILLSAAYCYRKKAGFLLGAISLSVLLVCSFIQQDRNVMRRETIVVYNTSHTSAADIFKGKQTIAVYGTATGQKAKNVRYTETAARLYFRSAATVSQGGQKGVYMISDKRILFWNEPAYLPENDSFPVDFLVAGNSSRLAPRIWKRVFRPRLVILDGSVPRGKAIKWSMAIKKSGMNVHCVATQGAWVYTAIVSEQHKTVGIAQKR